MYVLYVLRFTWVRVSIDACVCIYMYIYIYTYVYVCVMCICMGMSDFACIGTFKMYILLGIAWPSLFDLYLTYIWRQWRGPITDWFRSIHGGGGRASGMRDYKESNDDREEGWSGRKLLLRACCWEHAEENMLLRACD